MLFSWIRLKSLLTLQDIEFNNNMTINPAFSLGVFVTSHSFSLNYCPIMKNSINLEKENGNCQSPPKMQIKQCNTVRHTLAFNNTKNSNKDDAIENSCNVKIIHGNISF